MLRKKNYKKIEKGSAFSKKGGANSNQAHLGPPEDSSRRLLLLEEATLLAWAARSEEEKDSLLGTSLSLKIAEENYFREENPS